MPQVINTNIASLTSQRALNSSQNALQTALQRLSTGLRVNSAKDDAAGIAVGARMDTQVRGMNVAIRNANDGISLAQTAEAGMATVTEMLQRMRELSVQAANSTNTTGTGGDVDKLNDEYTQLGAEVQRNLQSVQFNGQTLLSGVTSDFTFQVGANTGATQQITVASGSLNLGGTAVTGLFGTGTASALSTGSNAGNSANLVAIDAAISAVNTSRAKLGAVQSRFENTINFLRSSVENQSAAKGRIMDADFAAETANLSRTQILQQAGTAMISQANQVPQNVLTLLR